MALLEMCYPGHLLAAPAASSPTCLEAGQTTALTCGSCRQTAAPRSGEAGLALQQQPELDKEDYIHSILQGEDPEEISAALNFNIERQAAALARLVNGSSTSTSCAPGARGPLTGHAAGSRRAAGGSNGPHKEQVLGTGTVGEVEGLEFGSVPLAAVLYLEG